MQEENTFDVQKLQEQFCRWDAWELETGVLLVADSLKTAHGETLLANNLRWGILYMIQEGAFQWEEPPRTGTESVRPDKQGRRAICTDNGLTKYDLFHWGIDTLHSTEAYLRALAALHGGRIEKLSRETILHGKTVFYVKPASFVAWAHSVGIQIPEEIRNTFPCLKDVCDDARGDRDPKVRVDLYGNGCPTGSEGQASRESKPSEETTIEGQGKQAERSGVHTEKSTEGCQDEQTENEMRFDKASGSWEVTFKGHTVLAIKNLKGMRYIAHILCHPEKGISTYELRCAVEGRSIGISCSVDGISKDALLAYRNRRAELQGSIDKARRDQINELVNQYEQELEELEKEINRTTRHDGKPRQSNRDLENIRNSVCGAIKYAYQKLDEQCPDLVSHFQSTIELGQTIYYRPGNEADFNVIFSR